MIDEPRDWDPFTLSQKGYSNNKKNSIRKIYIYYKLEHACATNLGSFLLLQIGVSVAANWGSSGYYKLGKMSLKAGAAITNYRIHCCQM